MENFKKLYCPYCGEHEDVVHKNDCPALLRRSYHIDWSERGGKAIVCQDYSLIGIKEREDWFSYSKIYHIKRRD